jgi:hypothetical protein
MAKEVVKLTPEMQQAWVDWDPGYEPKESLTVSQSTLVRMAFFDGWIACQEATYNNPPKQDIDRARAILAEVHPDGMGLFKDRIHMSIDIAVQAVAKALQVNKLEEEES